LLGLFSDEVVAAGGGRKWNFRRKNRMRFKPGSGANEEADIRVNAHCREYGPAGNGVKLGSLMRRLTVLAKPMDPLGCWSKKVLNY